MGAGQHGAGNERCSYTKALGRSKTNWMRSCPQSPKTGWAGRCQRPREKAKSVGSANQKIRISPEPFHLALVRYSLIVKDFQHEPNFLQNNARLDDGFVRLPEDAC